MWCWKNAKKTVGNKVSEASHFVRKSWWDGEKWQLLQKKKDCLQIMASKRTAVKKRGEKWWRDKGKDTHLFCHFQPNCYHYQYAYSESAWRQNGYESSKTLPSSPSQTVFSIFSSRLHKGKSKRGGKWRKRWGALRTTQAKVAVLLWLRRLIYDSPVLSMRLQILRNSIHLRKPWDAPQGGNDRFLHRLCPCSSVTTLDFIDITESGLEKQRKTRAAWITKASITTRCFCRPSGLKANYGTYSIWCYKRHRT